MPYFMRIINNSHFTSIVVKFHSLQNSYLKVEVELFVVFLNIFQLF